ncbi:MAG: hypothetical protein AAF493_29850, partial [Pseudomonadota bacterium]
MGTQSAPRHLAALFGLLLCVLCQAAVAQSVVLPGAGSGFDLDGTNTASGCSVPYDGTHAASGTITFTSTTTVAGTVSYNANVDITDANMLTFNGTLSGTYNVDGTGLTGSGSYTGGFMGGTWTVASGSVADGSLQMTLNWLDLCTGFFQFTGDDPSVSTSSGETTTGSEATAGRQQQFFVRELIRIS